jgi:hypothetical protein
MFAHDSCERDIKCKLDLVGIQEVRYDKGGTEPAGEYTLFCGEGNENLGKVQVFSYIRNRISNYEDRISFG